MEYIEKLKKMLCKELDEYAMKTKLTMADVEVVHKLTDTVKNLDKIAMLEEDDGYSEARYGRQAYHDGAMYSERRGRGRYAKRDSMGRYSSEEGLIYDDGASYDDSLHYGKGYSRDDAKDHMMSKLGEMMESADPNQRKILKEAMRKIEEA